MSIERWKGYRRYSTYKQWNSTQPLKKKELMPSEATWMNLEIIISSEVSQKDKYHMISLNVETKI